MSGVTLNRPPFAPWRILPALALILMVFAASQPVFPAMAQTSLPNAAGPRIGQISFSNNFCRIFQSGISPILAAPLNEEISGANAVSPFNWRLSSGTALDVPASHYPGPS